MRAYARGGKPRPDGQSGATLLEVVMAMAVLAIVLGGIYGVFVLAAKRAEQAQARARVQQEIRVAIDHMARELREASRDPAAVQFYNTACTGCAIGFRTARDAAGTFVVETNNMLPTYGQPQWQGVVYIYRDGAMLKRHADYSTTAVAGSPVTAPSTDPVVLSNVQEVEFRPTGNTIRLRLVALQRNELTAIQTDIEPENP